MRKFGQNWSFLVKMIKFGTFGDQNYVIGPPFRVGRYFFLLKTFSKFLNIILARFIDKNLVKNVINCVNLVKVGHFLVKMVNIGSTFVLFWGSKCRHMSKFWESGPIILSLKVSKIYFRFMDLNVVKNAINGVNLVKIGHFW